jgi:hypothetical protein
MNRILTVLGGGRFGCVLSAIAHLEQSTETDAAMR